VALHLGVAKDAIFLDGLPEARQEVVLRLALPKLNKHKGILPQAASGSCVAGRSAGSEDCAWAYQRSRAGECLAKQVRQ